MTPKQKNQKMQRLMILSFLIAEDLDDLKVTEPKMLKYKEDILSFVDELSNAVKDTNAILKTTYFQNISNKFDTILRKEFKNI
jgi:hypothetical protein